jgi:hypothetical protein
MRETGGVRWLMMGFSFFGEVAVTKNTILDPVDAASGESNLTPSSVGHLSGH